MIIRERKNFMRGVFMLGTFAILFVALLFPIMRDEEGKHITGLQYADNVFNELSKGSSYFIPMLREQVSSVEGKQVTISVALKKAELNEAAVAVLTKAGATAQISDGRVNYSGDLATLLTSAVDMSDRLYHNDGKAVQDLYGVEALQAARAWWYTLTPSIKELQKQGLIAEAKVVDQVVRRGIEPGNNFYSLPPAKVSDHILLLAAMLIFYVLYTLWYGFSIFELFEGFGLAMTKSKTKAES